MFNNVQFDLTQYEELNRREAMLAIRAGEKVVCRLVRNTKKCDFREISSMEELTETIQEEQRKFCDKLEFYKRK
jgi:hypothetical protein